MDKEAKEANNDLIVTPNGPYKSNLNQRQQQKSIKDLKNAYKQKKLDGQDKFGMVEDEDRLPSKRESVFQGKVNRNFGAN